MNNVSKTVYHAARNSLYWTMISLCATLIIANTSLSMTQRVDTVHIGAYLLSLHDINFHEREYTARFWLWIRYKNPQLHFEKYVEIPNAKTVEKSDTLIERQTDAIHRARFGKDSILFTLKMKCIMKEDWDVDDYPFDKEPVEIWVENSKYDTTNFVFIADSLGNFYDSLALLGWEKPIMKGITDFHKYESAFGDIADSGQSSVYSRYKLQIIMERGPWNLFFKLTLGMYVSFLIAFVGFFINPDNVDARFEIPIAGIFAVAGNAFAIEPQLPEGSKLTLVDWLQIVTLGSILLMIGVSAVSVYMRERSNKNPPMVPPLKAKFDRASILDMSAAFFILVVYGIINISWIRHAVINR